jgi:hypothetical protein
MHLEEFLVVWATLFNPTMLKEPFCGLRMTKDCSRLRKVTIFHPLIFGAAY